MVLDITTEDDKIICATIKFYKSKRTTLIHTSTNIKTCTLPVAKVIHTVHRLTVHLVLEVGEHLYLEVVTVTRRLRNSRVGGPKADTHHNGTTLYSLTFILSLILDYLSTKLSGLPVLSFPVIEISLILPRIITTTHVSELKRRA